MHPAIPICMVFVGCASNVIFLEFLVSEEPGCGNIVTCIQFLFITIERFVFYMDFGRKKTVIPLRNYLTLVSMFFVVQVVNNYALYFNISMPLHMIFRSGSLMANLVLGVIILKKRYIFSKYLSVILISIGIIICTLASADNVSSHPSHTGDEYYDFVMWIIGICMLTFALVASAGMGIFQETLYGKFGKHPSESMFFNHALPLPGFLFLSKDIYNHILKFNSSAPIVVPLVGLVPKMWCFMLLNTLTQYVCIRSVFILTTECTSLVVTLVVTLRKFLSLIISIWYFNNVFTAYHWFGAALVFVGTLIFTEVLKLGGAKEKEKLKES